MRSLKNGGQTYQAYSIGNTRSNCSREHVWRTRLFGRTRQLARCAPGRNLSRDTGRLLVGLWRPALPVWRLLWLPALSPALLSALPVPLLATKTRRGWVAPSAPILPSAGLSCLAFAYLLGQGFRV